MAQKGTRRGFKTPIAVQLAEAQLRVSRMECNADKVFYVDGFGKVGYANLYAFTPFRGEKRIADLQVNERTEGRFMNPTSDKKPERITRLS